MRDPRAGAVVTFQGVTREVERLEYEAYAEMAEPRIEAILREAIERHGLCAAAAEHRVGTVPLSEPSVLVAVSAPHRGEAFAGAREVIDRIKAEAPIWKKEVEGGEERWVEGTAPAADRRLAARRRPPRGGSKSMCAAISASWRHQDGLRRRVAEQGERVLEAGLDELEAGRGRRVVLRARRRPRAATACGRGAAARPGRSRRTGGACGRHQLDFGAYTAKGCSAVNGVTTTARGVASGSLERVRDPAPVVALERSRRCRRARPWTRRARRALPAATTPALPAARAPSPAATASASGGHATSTLRVSR